MKRTILAVLALCCMIATATTSASAYFVGSTDVGGLDQLIGSGNLSNSGEATEIAWIQSVIGGGYVVTSYVKTNFANGAPEWQVTNDASVYALATPNNPEYFMIKTGNLKGDPDYSNFLFQNLDRVGWVVLDLDESFIIDLKEIGQLSHIGEVNGGEVPVPEPGTMMLLGVGMFGLAIFGKRRMNK